MRLSKENERDRWVRGVLTAIPKGQSLLDVGAGECPYKSSATHLDYVSQDVAKYDGTAPARVCKPAHGTSPRSMWSATSWIFPKTGFSMRSCARGIGARTDCVAALNKVCRLVKPGGRLIVTAPFASYTHFAPYHYATGFSRYFYEWHLPRAGFEIVQIQPSGSYFDLIAKENKRARQVHKKYLNSRAPMFERLVLMAAWVILRSWAKRERKIGEVRSSEFATRGWHVIATNETMSLFDDVTPRAAIG